MVNPSSSSPDIDLGGEPRDAAIGNLALDCYVSAIRNVAQYAIDLEPELTEPHRKYLEELAAFAASGAPEALKESRATLRALLREYRDKTSQYLNILREDLGAAAVALEEMLEALGDGDGDQGDQLRAALRTLRQAPGDDCDSIRETVSGAAGTIETCLAGVRKHHQLAVSQFMIEIRMLHKRIDALESAASVDMVTRLFPRHEMEARVREGQGPGRLLLVRADGVHAAQGRFGRAVAEELTGALIRRLRNTLPAASAVARWSEQGFVTMLDMDAGTAAQLAARIAANLTGSYACVKDGKTVRPAIHPQFKLLEPASLGADETLRQAADFFGE